MSVTISLKHLNSVIGAAERKMDSWSSGAPPTVVHHYTTPSGLLGILNTGTIYMSDAYFLNDQSELRYGYSVVAGVLAEKLASAANDSKLTTLLAPVHKFFDSGGERSSIQFRFYVSSFCEDGNLLSQWRAYGAAGYSLGFDFSRLEKVAQSLDPERSTSLTRLEYRSEYQKRLIEFIIERFCGDAAASLKSAATTSDLKAVCVATGADLMLALATFVPRIKHPVFAEEREWRLIYGALGSKVLKRVNFRQSGTSIIPYLSLNLREKEHISSLPLSEITHAPAPEPELRKRSIKELLVALDYPESNVAIRGSDIPLRVL